jgi:hypothetical protein
MAQPRIGVSLSSGARHNGGETRGCISIKKPTWEKPSGKNQVRVGAQRKNDQGSREPEEEHVAWAPEGRVGLVQAGTPDTGNGHMKTWEHELSGQLPEHQ